MQDKFKMGIAGVETEMQRDTEDEELIPSYILDEKNSSKSSDYELQKKI